MLVDDACRLDDEVVGMALRSGVRLLTGMSGGDDAGGGRDGRRVAICCGVGSNVIGGADGMPGAI